MSETEYLIISDPEGCGSKVYFRGNQSPQLCQDTTFVALNNWISEEGKTRKIVFCGDYFDNGPVENIEEFIKTMMRLYNDHNKKKKIIILLGNRDLNKLRLAKEIGFFNVSNKIDGIKNINEIYRPFEEISSVVDKPFPNKNDFYSSDVTNPSLFEFYKKTMGIDFNVDKTKLVQFFKNFWSKENPEGEGGTNPNQISMMDFFKNCDIIHIENGIFFAHGGIDLKYFNEFLLNNTDLITLQDYFKNKLTNALNYVENLPTTSSQLEDIKKHFNLSVGQNLLKPTSSELEDIKKHFNLSVGQNLLKPTSSQKETEHPVDDIITYYDYKLKNMKYNWPLDSVDDEIDENEKAYYFLLNLSFYQAYSPVMCSGGINGDCEQNKAMDNLLIDFYINKNINTLVLGHKPICFPIPLGFYDIQFIAFDYSKSEWNKKMIYTFANDLMGYRDLIIREEPVIPLGILKKNTKGDWNQPPKFSVSYLFEGKIQEPLTDEDNGFNKELTDTNLNKIVELINNGNILHSEAIVSENPPGELFRARSIAEILKAYTSYQTLKPPPQPAKGGGLQIRRKSRKSRRIRRNSRRNRIKKRKSTRNRIKKRNIRKTKKNRRKSKRF